MINIPIYITEILDRLEKRGYEAYLVGGCVRDMIRGKKAHDWDIATKCTPEEVMKVFKNTIPTGLKYGTVTVLWKNRKVEVTTFRKDNDYSDNRHPENVCFTSEIADDLKRRDFTMNAIAMDRNGRIYDPFGGIEDIRSKTIKCVGDPKERFSEDALRILRAIRFSSVLGFEIEPKTQSAMNDCIEMCSMISGDRIRNEITKVINSDNPSLVEQFFKYKALEFEVTDSKLLSRLKSLNKSDDLRLFALSRICGKEKFLDRINAKKTLIKYSKIADAYNCLCEKDARYIYYKEGKEALKYIACSEYSEGKITLPEMKKYVALTPLPLCVSGKDILKFGYRGKQVGDKLDELIRLISENPQKNTTVQLNYYLNQKKVSNYEITKEMTAAAFVKFNEDEILSRPYADYDAHYYYVEMFCRKYRVSRATGMAECFIEKRGVWMESDYNEAMTLYDLLGYSKILAHPANDYINLRSLSSIQGSGKGLGDDLFIEQASVFDGNENILKEVLAGLGGEPWTKGDVASIIPGFWGLKFVVQFWSSDEEFPPTIHVFTDKNILDYMHYETVWYAVAILIKRISEEYYGKKDMSI